MVLHFWTIRKKSIFKNRQISQKLSISAGETYWKIHGPRTISVLVLCKLIQISQKYARKWLYIFVHSDLDLWHFDLKFALPVILFYGHISPKFEVPLAFQFLVNHKRKTDDGKQGFMLRPRDIIIIIIMKVVNKVH